MKKHFFLSFAFLVFSIAIFSLYSRSRQDAPQLIKTKISQIIPTKSAIQIAPLTLEKIFFGEKQYLRALPQNELITIISTGDIIPARMVNLKSTQRNDFTWAFKNVAPFLVDADLTLANLEAPMMKNCTATGEGMTFCGSDRHMEGIKQAGIDLVTLANNHIDNYGQEGILETAKLLKNNNISFTGLGEPALLTIKNLRLAFLGYNFLPETDLKKISGEISDAKNNSDFVIVFPHWGEEYEEMPTAFQQETQEKLLEAGADLILGNHPHIIQPLAINNNTLTFFAHGNFIFDQMWSEATKKGFILKTYIYKGKIIDAQLTPVYIEDFGQPRIVTGEEGEKMKKELYKLSLKYLSF